MKRIPKKSIEKWVQALRSGEYEQGINQLQSRYGYCCLGVACDVFISESKQELNVFGKIKGGFPDDQTNAPLWLKKINDDFYNKTGYELSVINDIKGFTFNEIADLLEAVYLLEVLK